MSPVDGDLYPVEFYTRIGPASGDVRYRQNVQQEVVMGVKASAGDGTYYLINPKQFNTDNQSIQITLAANQSPMASANDDDSELKTVAHLHCDATGTGGSYCAVYDDRIEVGTFTHSDASSFTLPATLPITLVGGSAFTYTPVTTYTSPRPIVAQNRVEFRNNGTTFKVFIDDAEVLTATINPTRDSSHRYSMVSIDRKTFSGEKQDSFWISLIAASDYIPQAYLGSGAKMSRTASGDLSLYVDYTWRPFPPGLYTTTVRATTDIQSVHALNSFIVSVEGWYEVKFNTVYGFSSGGTPYNPLVFGLLKNGSLYEAGNAAVADLLNNMSWNVYLSPGDSIQPGYIALSGPAGTWNYGFPGELLSAYSYFTVTLSNRSTT